MSVLSCRIIWPNALLAALLMRASALTPRAEPPLPVVDAHQRRGDGVPAPSLPSPPSRSAAKRGRARVDSLTGVRGGAQLRRDAKPKAKGSKSKSAKEGAMPSTTSRRAETRRGDIENGTTRGDERDDGVQVLSVLIPRPTSFMVPLRFAALLLVSVGFRSCLRTAGRPLEDAVRRILDMPSPGGGGDDFASRVTPLHVYVARKIGSTGGTSSSSSAPREMLPPGHLPSPLSLLGLLCSVLLCVGGTVLLPRWNVDVYVLLNYAKYDIIENDEKCVNDAGCALQNWFESNKGDDVDPYYESPGQRLTPAVLVHDMDASGKTEVCPLATSPRYDFEHDAETQHPRRYYFELHQKRFYYDPMHTEDDNVQLPRVVGGGPTLHEIPPMKLLSDSHIRGLSSNSKLSYASERYSAYSDITIPVPTLKDAFVQRITSPLVSLQLVGRFLSLIEEDNIGRALSNLARLGIDHFLDAKRSVACAITLAEDVKGIEQAEDNVGNDGSRFWALRPANMNAVKRSETVQPTWVKVSSKELLPGDVFVIGPAANSSLPFLRIPVDALLLDGTCVTEEAALTGESVAQAKVAIDWHDSSQHLDMNGIHRSSCVFAGTSLIHSLNNRDGGIATTSCTKFNLPPLPRETYVNNEYLPAVFLALRTGSYSSRGQIIQSLLKRRLNVGITSGENERDSIRLIGALSMFAVGSCLYLLFGGSTDKDTPDLFKRIVQCTRIAVASVPSELPASIAACVQECVSILREESDAVNSESGALLDASKVDTVVFDKTGTLTSDTQSLSFIEYPPLQQLRKRESLQFVANVILAGGHTLVGRDNETNDLIGDPVDLAALKYSRWKYDAQEKCAVSPSREKLWPLRTFPFDPIKKLSSAVVLVQSKKGEFHLWIVVKGSPSEIEHLQSGEMCDLNRSWYNEKVQRLGKKGYRILGLAALDVTSTRLAEILFPSNFPRPDDDVEPHLREARRLAQKSLNRSDIEGQSKGILGGKGMTFVGFACFDAPLRPSSRRVIGELRRSVKVIILTGDEPYASVEIGKQTGIGKANICLLKTDDTGLVWEVDNAKREFTLKSARMVRQKIMSNKSVLVATGDAVRSLLSTTVSPSLFVQTDLLPHVSIVASASPDDKSLLVGWLQSCNQNIILMCGDGVNDCAAMRKAKVSVAMLSGFEQSIGAKNVDAEDVRRMERVKRRRIGSNRMQTTMPPKSSANSPGVGNTFTASIARIQNGIIKRMQEIESEDNDTPQHVTVIDIAMASVKDEFRRRNKLKRGGSQAANILAEEDRLLASSKATADHEFSEANGSQIQTGESCLASSFTLLRPCISGVETILRIGVSAAAARATSIRKVALNCMLNCHNLATVYSNGLRYGKWMWQIEMACAVSIENASFTSSSAPRPRLVAGVRPSTTPFCLPEMISIMLQAFIHIVTLTVAINIGIALDKTHQMQKSPKGLGIKWIEASGASPGGLLASLVGKSASTSLHSDANTPKRSFFKKPSFQPNYVANNVFIMSIFQNAVSSMVNHNGRPFSITFMENRPHCLLVSLSFLLSIVCLAESFPEFNRWLQLAKYPTKSSQIAMLRVLLVNVSMSYLAEYFVTFFLRNQLWRERNMPNKDVRDNSSLTVATEEKLLEEEHDQNSKIVSIICFLIFYFSVRILKVPAVLGK